MATKHRPKVVKNMLKMVKNRQKWSFLSFLYTRTTKNFKYGQWSISWDFCLKNGFGRVIFGDRTVQDLSPFWGSGNQNPLYVEYGHFCPNWCPCDYKKCKNGHFWRFLPKNDHFWTTFDLYLVGSRSKMCQILAKFDHFWVVLSKRELFLSKNVSKWHFFHSIRRPKCHIPVKQRTPKFTCSKMVIFVSKWVKIHIKARIWNVTTFDKNDKNDVFCHFGTFLNPPISRKVIFS